MDSLHGNTFELLLLACPIWLMTRHVVALPVKPISHHTLGITNYFCETGNYAGRILISDDPLWDGEGCGPGYSCECTLHSPPWFKVQLTNPTDDDIEVRSCSYEGTGAVWQA